LFIRPYLNDPRLPHFAQGNKIQQLATNAKKITTCVQYGVRKRLPLLPRLETFAQSRLKFKNPMPPNPAPMKLALGFRGATQQRKARDPSIGKAYSGRNCQRVTAVSTAKKTYICFLEVDDGCSLWFFCVSKRAV